MAKIFEDFEPPSKTFLATSLISEGPTHVHHSRNSERAIQRCFLKYDPALKSHPIGDCFFSTVGVCNIIQF